MPKMTRKYSAALEQAKQIGGGEKAIVRQGMDQETLYGILERHGYSWDSDNGKWNKWQTPPGSPKSGIVAVRLRADMGDVERAAKLIGQALEAKGFKIRRLSPPDPDDRDGPAVTARVYMEWMLPEE